jgi:hypothetical protein
MMQIVAHGFKTSDLLGRLMIHWSRVPDCAFRMTNVRSTIVYDLSDSYVDPCVLDLNNQGRSPRPVARLCPGPRDRHRACGAGRFVRRTRTVVWASSPHPGGGVKWTSNLNLTVT